jgi:hypothetical protein
MITDEQLQAFKRETIEFIDSITKEEFIRYDIDYGYDEISLSGEMKRVPNGTKTLTITISRSRTEETDE